jgi:hypothetical protein
MSDHLCMARGYDRGYSFRSSDFRSQSGRGRRQKGRDPEFVPADLVPVPAAAPEPDSTAAPRRASDRRDPRACPGPCNGKYAKAWDEYEQAAEEYKQHGAMDSARSRPEPPLIGCWLGEPAWCPACASAITVRLAELDDLAALLSATADGHRSSAEPERVSGSSEPASPSQAADDLDEMSAMLSGWETIYRELNGWLSPPPRGELASKETACIDWLRRHLGGILASEIGADFGLEILQWHRESAGSAKAGVRTLRKPMRCPSPNCRNLTLFWTEGDTNVYCKAPDCGRILTLAQYETELERQADILKRGGEAAAQAAS